MDLNIGGAMEVDGIYIHVFNIAFNEAGFNCKMTFEYDIIEGQYNDKAEFEKLIGDEIIKAIQSHLEELDG